MNIATSLSEDSQVIEPSVDVMRVGKRLSRQACLTAWLLACFLVTGCSSGGGGETSGGPPGVGASCSVAQLESDMDSVLATVPLDPTDTQNFSFAVERQDGRRYSYNRGTSTLQTPYESASTSKLVSAVIILRQVERGALSLTDSPQNYISGWPIGSSDSLYSMTLAQLMSFTSGLRTEPLCLNSGLANFETCVNNIATTNAGNGIVPGQQFHYGSSHLQVAGLMAVKARGVPVATWQDLFAEFQNETGLFRTAPTTAYDLPSSANPRLAGGMHWTGEEYLAFLKALKNGTLLSSTMNEFLADHTPSPAVVIASSPIALTPPNGLGENWHYGLGHWLECPVSAGSAFTCSSSTARLSSPGAYGAYPFWDRSKGYTGMVARQGTIGTFPNGIAIERSVRLKVEQWVACQ